MTKLHGTTTLALSAATAALICLSPVSAQEPKLEKPNGFPERPITAVVPFGPGGGADTMTRAWGEPLSKAIGTEITVVNQPGGGGFAALPDYMSRPKDGYTILEHDNTLLAGELQGKVSFDVLQELDPICVTNVAYAQLYIRSDESRFSDWASFVKYAKEHPGTTTVGNVGDEMVQVNLLEDSAGIKLNQINFDKPAERYASVIGGHVDVLYEQPGDVLEFIKSKDMKPILTFVHGEAPSVFPPAPTLTKSGLGDVKVVPLVRMFWVHKAAPQERREFLQQGCNEAYQSDHFQNFLKDKLLPTELSYMDAKTTLEEMRSQKEVYQAYYRKTGVIK